MSEIPDDVMAKAREVQKAIRADRSDIKVCTGKSCSCDKFCEAKRLIIARAILAERERAASVCEKMADACGAWLASSNVRAITLAKAANAIRSGQ